MIVECIVLTFQLAQYSKNTPQRCQDNTPLDDLKESWNWSTTHLDDLTEVSAFRTTLPWMIGQRSWLHLDLCPIICGSVVLNALTSVISSMGSVGPMPRLFKSSSGSAVLTPPRVVFLSASSSPGSLSVGYHSIDLFPGW